MCVFSNDSRSAGLAEDLEDEARPIELNDDLEDHDIGEHEFDDDDF